MHHTVELPEGYRKIFEVNLAEDKKMAIRLNLVAMLIGILVALPAALLVPIAPLFDLSDGFGPYILRFGAILLGSFLYIILHEATHGITMKLFGVERVKYGFKGVFAYAGCDEYLGKTAYIAVALAPVVLFSVLLGILSALVPTAWFWVVYIIQIQNISGAVGDFYVTLRFLRMPRDILVRDEGVGMTVYSSQYQPK